MIAGGADGECVAVGDRLGYDVRPNGAAGTRFVFDDDLLFQFVAELGGEITLKNVGGTARWKAENNPDRLGRPRLRRYNGGG